MLFHSCFDIIGPIMVGPSSSHTAGVVAIGNYVYRQLKGIPEKTEIIFYGSFSRTYKGHGTDKAVIGGLLGYQADDTRIRYSLITAREIGMEINYELDDICPFYDHPNVILIKASTKEKKIEIGGISLGGGLSKIVYVNGQQVDINLSLS